jgi:hypothetical protein
MMVVLLLLPQEASVRGQLYMDTFQRLNLGLLLQSSTCLVVLAQAISMRNPLLTGEAGCTLLQHSAMPFSVFYKRSNAAV